MFVNHRLPRVLLLLSLISLIEPLPQNLQLQSLAQHRQQQQLSQESDNHQPTSNLNSRELSARSDDHGIDDNSYNNALSQRNREEASQPLPAVSKMDKWKRVCYFRMDPRTEIKLSQVDGSICTHVILAFARIDSDGTLALEKEQDASDYLSEIREFKLKYPDVKLMISVLNEQVHNGFSRAARSEFIRRKFVISAIKFLQRYELDGIDLDWEFPNFPSTIIVREYERQGLSKILTALRSAIVENFYDRQVAQQQHQQHDSYHLSSAQASSAAAAANHASNGYYNNNNNNNNSIIDNDKPVEPYLLTVAVAGQDAILSASYELKEVANLCDWLNVMSYDYYQFKAYSPFTGPNSPLYPIVEHYVPIMSKLAHSWTYNRLINDEGIPRDKIVLGIPTYARAYKLVFRNSRPAPFSLSSGSKGGRIEDYLDYREVCDLLGRPDTVAEFDARARVPYLLTDAGYTWVSYEDTRSIREKVKFALDAGLAGYMTWNLNSDDFTGLHHAKLPAGAKADETNAAAAANGHLAANATTFPLHRAMLDEVRRFYSSDGRK